MSDGILKAVGTILFVVLLMTISAFLSGTILYLTYEHIHALFPSAAKQGIIAKELGWWDSVCVTWIFTVLIKMTSVHKRSR